MGSSKKKSEIEFDFGSVRIFKNNLFKNLIKHSFIYILQCEGRAFQLVCNIILGLLI